MAILVGPRGSGKTTLATALAGAIGCEWADLDDEIESAAGRSPAAIIRSDGIDAFREWELRLLPDLLARPGCIVATGGGTVTVPALRDLLLEQRDAGRPVIRLTAPPEVLADRVAVAGGSGRRPRLTGEPDAQSETRRLLADREPLYAAVTSHQLDTNRAAPSELVAQALPWLAGWLAGR